MSNAKKPPVVIGLTDEGAPIYRHDPSDAKLVFGGTGGGPTKSFSPVFPLILEDPLSAAIKKQLEQNESARGLSFLIIDEFGVFNDE
ncbi:MAG: hypothetical protein ACE37E_11220 [Hyphomicrobiales bacterium]